MPIFYGTLKSKYTKDMLTQKDFFCGIINYYNPRGQYSRPPLPPRGQTWTFGEPPLPPRLSTWFVDGALPYNNTG